MSEKRIMLVDDSSMMRLIIRNLLVTDPNLIVPSSLENGKKALGDSFQSSTGNWGWVHPRFQPRKTSGIRGRAIETAVLGIPEGCQTGEMTRPDCQRNCSRRGDAFK